MMNLGAGLKWAAIAAIVLAVGWTSFSVIQSVRERERDKITIELQEETNKLRKEIRDAVNSGSPDGDDADSLQYLRDRQGDTEESD